MRLTQRFIAGLFALMTVIAAAPAAYADCANPTAVEGEAIYNDDYNVLQFCDGTSWISTGGSGSGGGATVTGNDTEVQFNNGGNLAGATQMLWDAGNNRLTVGSATASSVAATVDVTGKTASNSVIMKPVAGAAAAASGGGSGGGFQSLTTTQRDALSSPAEGMMIYNTTNHRPEYYNGTIWQAFGLSSAYFDGSSAAAAAASCFAIMDGGYSTTDGVYWIDPDGLGTGNAAFEAYCDMTTSGGGWTLVFNTTGTSSSYPDTPYTTTSQNFDISGRFSGLDASSKLVKVNATNYTGNVYSASSTNVWSNGTQTLNRALTNQKFRVTVSYATGYALIGAAPVGGWCNGSGDLLLGGVHNPGVGYAAGSFAYQSACDSGVHYKQGGFTMQVYTR